MNIRVEELYEYGQRKMEAIPNNSTLTESEARVWRFITKFPKGIASIAELHKKYSHKLQPNKDIVWIASKRYWRKGIGYIWAGLAFDAAAKVGPIWLLMEEI